MATHQDVYTGLWTNHAYTTVTGATLTLTSRDGAYLIALVALFVHVVGTSFWRLISYAVFQLRARPALQDTVKLQEQMIFRNSPSAVSGLRNFIFLAMRSRRKTHPRPSTIALLCTAAVNLTAFLAAGILSSKVTITRSDVLLVPTNCGRWWEFGFANVQHAFDGNQNQADYYSARSAINDLRHTSSQYATVCYETDNPPEECTSFGRRAPTWSTSLHSGCPFSDWLCEGNITLSIDSGYIDSALDLGINTPSEERLSLHLIKECAPLNRKDYVKAYDGTNITDIIFDPIVNPSQAAAEQYGRGWKDYTYDAFFYGQSYFVAGSNATFIWTNATMAVNDAAMGDMPVLLLYEDLYSQCQSDSSVAGPDLNPHCPSSFLPIPELQVDGYNTVILYLTPYVYFLEEVEDPWFRADIAVGGKTFGFPFYYRQPWTSTLACAEKTELCKPSTNGAPACVQLNANGWPLGSLKNAPANITSLLGLSQQQTAIANRLQDASYRGDSTSLLADLGGQSMLAYQQITNNIAAGLPNDQWVREIEHWFATQLITMQSYSTEFVTGYQDSSLNHYITPPDEADMWMCDSQVIQRKDYTSFSVLGICTILVVGGFVVLLNMTITWLVNRIRPRTPMQLYKKESWKANDLLELQGAAGQAIQRRAVDASRQSNIPCKDWLVKAEGETVICKGEEL